MYDVHSLNFGFFEFELTSLNYRAEGAGWTLSPWHQCVQRTTATHTRPARMAQRPPKRLAQALGLVLQRRRF